MEVNDWDWDCFIMAASALRKSLGVGEDDESGKRTRRMKRKTLAATFESLFQDEKRVLSKTGGGGSTVITVQVVCGRLGHSLGGPLRNGGPVVHLLEISSGFRPLVP